MVINSEIKGSSELVPSEIRRIRRSLGLTQVEAGELLGGGPRAFSKYESGTIKPSASVTSLLRLLDANPSAIGTLTGSPVVPIEAEYLQPFQVSGEHVAALTERKFVLLVGKLLNAEAQSSGLPMDGIHVAANIFAADGGEDGRVEWQGGAERTDYLPSRLCQFQMKAGEISPSEAAADILEKPGLISKVISDVLLAGGTYIIMCGHRYTKKLIQRRQKAVVDKLRDCGLDISDEQVQFRDADDIANWVNSRRTVATWLLEQTQPGIVGPFKDWTHWAGRFEHDNSPWIEDVRFPDFRGRLRQLICQPMGIVRVIGASGVGKSRFALEALGPSRATEDSGTLLSDIVLYSVASDAGSAAIKNSVQILVDTRDRAIVVVDRCDRETHNDIAAMVKRGGSRVSLVTIDHDFCDEEKGNNDHIFLDHAPDNVISGILATLLPELCNEDQRRLLQFARGFPRIAQLLANAWLHNLPIASASDDDLVSRIILGRKSNEPALIMAVAKLVSAFNLIGFQEPLDADLADLVGVSRGLSESDIRVALTELLDRGVCQLRGRLVVLQPRPIALSLAAAQWKEWNSKQWDNVLAGSITDHLRLRAANQLALLNTGNIADIVVQNICRIGGPLDSVQALIRPCNMEVLSALAEVSAEVVADLLLRILAPLSVVELMDIKDEVRRNLVWTLEKVAFLNDTFGVGARLLLKLAVAENETWGNNSVGQFKALFPSFLANTQAPPELRLRLLDEELESNDHKRLLIVTEALLEGAKTDFFSRAVGSESHGSRPALEPWKPETWGEAWEYVIQCGDRLAQLALRDDEIGALARSGFGHHFRTYVLRGLIDYVERWVAIIGSVNGYWPEALASLGDIFQYDADEVDSEILPRIENLIDKLTPRSLEHRVKFIVSEMPWDFPCDEQLDYRERDRRQLSAVEELVIEMLNDPPTLTAVLPQLSVGDHRHATAFGGFMTLHAKNPEAWLEAVKTAYLEAPSGNRSFSLLAGVAAGLKERAPDLYRTFKKQAAASSDFANCLPFVCLRAGIEDEDVSIVGSALEAEILDPKSLAMWTVGGELAKRGPQVVGPLFTQMLARGGICYSIALDIIGMYVHGEKDRLTDFRLQLILAAKQVHTIGKDRRNEMDAHHFKEIMEWLLDKGSDDPTSREVASILAQQLAFDPQGNGRRLIELLLPKLFSHFPEIVWPHIGKGIAENREKSWFFQRSLGDRHSFNNIQKPAVLSVPEEMLFAWCHANPEIGPAFLASIVPVLTNRDPSVSTREFHSLTKRLLNEFGEREDVQGAFVSNMHTYGWSGSLTTYYSLFEQPLLSLNDHPVGAVRRWGKRILKGIRGDIKREQTRDDEQSAHWDV